MGERLSYWLFRRNSRASVKSIKQEISARSRRLHMREVKSRYQKGTGSYPFDCLFIAPAIFFVPGLCFKLFIRDIQLR